MVSNGDELCSASLTGVGFGIGEKNNSRPGLAEQISTVGLEAQIGVEGAKTVRRSTIN
jgi:hypothetical protein